MSNDEFITYIRHCYWTAKRKRRTVAYRGLNDDERYWKGYEDACFELNEKYYDDFA